MNGAIGNVNGIVESFYTADALKSSANTKDNSSYSFQDYLNAALNNYKTGMLTGSGLYGSNYYGSSLYNTGLYNTGLYGSGMYGNYGSILSGVAVNALLSRVLESQAANSSQEKSGGSQESEQEKPAWASIRVIRRYQEPAVQPQAGKVNAIC